MIQDEFISILQTEFHSQIRKDPSLSLRTFAKSIKLSPGTCSDLLNRRNTWKLSNHRMVEVLNQMPGESQEKNQLLLKIGEIPQYKKVRMEEKDHEILLDWTYLPILVSFDLPSHQRSPLKIAQRLGLSLEKVEAVIKDLVVRGMLELHEGQLRRPEVEIYAGDGPSSEIIKRHHMVTLQTSERALETLPAARRDFTSMSFTGTEAQMELLRTEIRKLYEKAPTLVRGTQEEDTVFQLAIQFYPMDFKNED